MISTEPQVLSNGRYSIEETCKALMIHRNSLARYAKRGCIKCYIRKSTGRKFYLGSDILRFWKLHI